jgi:hypothetical protein
VFTVANTTGLDVTASNTGFGNTETATASTTAATAVFGVATINWSLNDLGYTPGTGWSAGKVSGAWNIYFIRQDFASSGSKSTGGVWGNTQTWATVWAAYK